MKLPKTREKAQLLNSFFYFTGKKCKRGHISKRRTQNAECYKCRTTALSLYVKEQPPNKTKRMFEKLRARQKIQSAIRKGKFKKLPCEKCGKKKDVHAHHDDYSKPFKVQFLCRKHHQERHEELKKLGIVI
jgi:hypothetical protein